MLHGVQRLCGPLGFITEKTDNLSKTESKVKARLCTMGNSSKEFSKDSVQFEFPSCGRDTVKAILSLVPDNKWRISTFDVSLAFFQGESLQREVYVKNPEIVLFLGNIVTTRLKHLPTNFDVICPYFDKLSTMK